MKQKFDNVGGAAGQRGVFADGAAEAAFGRCVADQLTHGTQTLRQGLANRLVTARREAVDHWQPAAAPVWGLAWLGNVGAQVDTSRYFQKRYVLPFLVLVAALAGGGYWQLSRNDIADIDANLLASDLPIDAYLDQGFDQWLKRSAY